MLMQKSDKDQYDEKMFNLIVQKKGDQSGDSTARLDLANYLECEDLKVSLDLKQGEEKIGEIKLEITAAPVFMDSSPLFKLEIFDVKSTSDSKDHIKCLTEGDSENIKVSKYELTFSTYIVMFPRTFPAIFKFYKDEENKPQKVQAVIDAYYRSEYFSYYALKP